MSRDRIDAAVHMNDIVVIKAADNMDNGVNSPDMAEELVPQPFTLAGPFDQTGNVNEFDGGRQNPLRD